MRVFDRDPIRGGHCGQRSCERANRPNTWLHRPVCNVNKVLANSEPSTHGRYCCKSRKSNCSENLAKVDFWTFLPLQGSVVPLRRSVVVFPLVSPRAKRISGPEKFWSSPKKTFSTLSAQSRSAALVGECPLLREHPDLIWKYRHMQWHIRRWQHKRGGVFTPQHPTIPHTRSRVRFFRIWAKLNSMLIKRKLRDRESINH